MSDTNQHAEVEIEFTFLPTKLPAEIAGVTPKRLVDVYIPETGVVHPNLRLRKRGDVLELTKKTLIAEDDASAQLEMTIPLSQDEYDALNTVSARRVVKDRYNVAIDGYPAEVDVFTEGLEGLVLIDFEFESEAKRAEFKTPAICMVDVTQEEFTAGGLLAGKAYADIADKLSALGYEPIK